MKYLNKKDRSTSTGSKIRAYKFEKQLKFLKPFLTAPQHFDADDFKIESPVTPDQVMSVTAYIDDDQYSNVCK